MGYTCIYKSIALNHKMLAESHKPKFYSNQPTKKEKKKYALKVKESKVTNPARRHGPRYRSQRIFRRLWRRQCRLERDQRGLIAGRDPRRSSSLARYPTAGPGASTSAPTTRNGSRTTASTTMTSSRSSDQLSFFLNSTYRREMQKQQERLFPSLSLNIYTT